jgi:hypothetical protein
MPRLSKSSQSIAHVNPLVARNNLRRFWSAAGAAANDIAMSSPRVVRYRRLALVERDSEKAELLRQLADEADQGSLFTVGHLPYDKPQPSPITPGDVKI